MGFETDMVVSIIMRAILYKKIPIMKKLKLHICLAIGANEKTF